LYSYVDDIKNINQIEEALPRYFTIFLGNHLKGERRPLRLKSDLERVRSIFHLMSHE
jgi:hypothetical protein